MKLGSNLPNPVNKWPGIWHGANMGAVITSILCALKQSSYITQKIKLWDSFSLKYNTDYLLLTLAARSLQWKYDVIYCK
jgi:hypothetical protein